VSARTRLTVALLALAFLVLHLRHVPPALEDIDSINLAMGVESFDVAKHQPHPPGYPIFMAMAKASTRAASLVFPDWDRDRTAAFGLAIWGVLAGAAAALVITRFWLAVGLPQDLSVLAAVLAVASPIFWITAARPLTDVPGLVAALVVHTWLLQGWRAVNDGQTRLPRTWMLAAFGVGLIPGLRSQAVWLTGPLTLWVLGEVAWRRRWSQAAVMVALMAIGVLTWAVPLLWLSGGLGGYLQAFGAQGAEDLAGGRLLARLPSLDSLVAVLSRTFIKTWQSPVLAQVVLVLAAIGTVRLVRRSPGILACIALAFWPYFVFDQTFHEIDSTRYALPSMVPMAGLAVMGLAAAGPLVARVGGIALAIASLWIAQPVLVTYGNEAGPLSRVVRDMIARRASLDQEPTLVMHHQLWWTTRRRLDWYRSQWNLRPVPFPGDHEWLSIVERFGRGERGPIWLLADLTRSDTSLFDPRAMTTLGRYGRVPALQQLVDVNRLDAAAWIELQPPGWMLGRGWALSPEVAGTTAKDGRQPHRVPAEGWLRRGPGAHRLLIGGRYLGGSGNAVLRLDLDGRETARWAIEPGAGRSFLKWIDLPAGALDGDSAYAQLTVRVESESGGPSPELGLEQFDFASAGALMSAFGAGWQEPEANPATGLFWRWSSDRNAMLVFAGEHDVQVRVAGESPLRYFDEAPTIRVMVDGREFGRFTPTGDFDESVRVPRSALGATPAEVIIETDRVFVPAEVSGSPDRRRLGLRVYQVEVSEIR
jgi:hypothetical protein